MKRNKEILSEVEAMSAVVSRAGDEMPYTVPDGYFDTLPTVIMARIAAGGNEENSFLNIADKQMPQDVPQGYFENLSSSILSKIKTTNQSAEEEVKELSPVIAGLQTINPYKVPAGYFEMLSENIAGKTNTSKVVSMFSKKTWVRLAVAASLILFVGFGLNFFLQKNNNQQLVSVMPQVKTDEQIKTELDQISDEEIIHYLKLNSDAKDVELIASFVDQNKLPAETEYMDDAFLDSFMKELEKTEQATN